ncbi:hyaluronan-mediated motility receptor [Gadus macrocephalus]|uniref:hyaluronan-mediated motility receptor n=1 Tax=Gadus macrocephalus TaxID=80720 RepID=UPI0028CB6C8C|nr:hyaluronan-mediated motility receptor [Gadus macrocephalus]
MRRFFRARDEDSSQIQYLTAKCHRLAHERAQLERDTLVTRERQRRLQNDLEAMAAHLQQKEQMIVELRRKQDHLVDHLNRQQGLVEFLKHHAGLRAEVGPTAEENLRDTELLATELEQLRSELLALQSSDGQLVGLVEELYAEAQHRAALVDSLQEELHSKSTEVEDLRRHRQKQREELEQLQSAHQRKVCVLQQENSSSVQKLQQTAVQFERLCKQQRYWMLCVKRYKDCLTEEREAVVQQVSDLEQTVLKPRGCSHCSRQYHCPLQDRGSNSRHLHQSMCGAEFRADQQGEPWSALCEDKVITQVGGVVDTEQKPP